MARRDNSNANPLLWIIFLIALYVSAFLVEVPRLQSPDIIYFGSLFDTSAVFSHTTLSVVLAAFSLLAIALTLHILNNSYASGLNYVHPLIYLILSVANPQSVYFSPFHISAIVFTLSCAFFVKYKADSQNLADEFVAFFLLVLSSCAFPPLIWTFPFVFLTGIGYAEYKSRYIVVSISAAFVAAALVMGLAYVISGFDVMAAVPESYFRAMTAIDVKSSDVTILQFCRDGILGILVIVAIIRDMRNQGKYRIAESRMLSALTLVTVLIFVVTVLFVSDIRQPFGLLLLAPASIVIFGLFGDSKKIMATIFSIIITAIIIAERVLGILQISNPLTEPMNHLNIPI